MWYSGKDTDKFDPGDGAKNLAGFLQVCIEKMRRQTRALGKTALRDLSRDDLFANDELTAKIADASS